MDVICFDILGILAPYDLWKRQGTSRMNKVVRFPRKDHHSVLKLVGMIMLDRRSYFYRTKSPSRRLSILTLVYRTKRRAMRLKLP